MGQISPATDRWLELPRQNCIPGERSTAADMCRYMDQRLQVPTWNLSGWNTRSFWSTWDSWWHENRWGGCFFFYLRLLKEWKVVYFEEWVLILMLWVPPCQFSCFFLRHVYEIIHETFTAPVLHPSVFGGIRNLLNFTIFISTILVPSFKNNILHMFFLHLQGFRV